MNVCPHCGSTNLSTTACVPPAPHHARTDCLDCGRFLRWEPAPMTLERAAAFVMPYGKCKGMALAEIAADADGARYLRWMLDSCAAGSLRRAIACLLDGRAGEVGR